MTLQTTTSAGAAKNVAVLGADSSVTFLGLIKPAGDSLTSVGAAGNRFLNVFAAQYFVGAALNMTDVADGRILGGTTGISIRNNANNANNVTISNIGVVVLRDTLRSSGKALFSALTAAGGTPNSACINAATKEITENAALTCTVSARRFKRNIAPLTLPEALRIGTQLRPVTFTYRSGGRRAIGLIAEEVDSVDKRLVSYDKQGRPNAVNYEEVAVIALRMVQQLQKRLDAALTPEAQAAIVVAVQHAVHRDHNGGLRLGINDDAGFRGEFRAQQSNTRANQARQQRFDVHDRGTPGTGETALQPVQHAALTPEAQTASRRFWSCWTMRSAMTATSS